MHLRPFILTFGTPVVFFALLGFVPQVVGEVTSLGQEPNASLPNATLYPQGGLIYDTTNRVGVINDSKSWGQITAATGAALNLFVATTGSDTNDCFTSGTPCLTIQAAVNKVPRRITHPVTITVAAGTYANGVYIEGFSFEPSVDANGAYLQLQGTMSTASHTGTMTGTAASATQGTGNTWGTFTVTAAGWTVSDLRGLILAITGGTGSGQITTIADNTATVITIPGHWNDIPGWVTPDNTSTFAIRDWSTSLSGTVNIPPGALGSAMGQASAAGAAIVVGNVKDGVHGNRDTQRVGAVQIQNFKFTGTTRAIYSVNTDATSAWWNNATSSLATDVAFIFDRTVFYSLVFNTGNLGANTGFASTARSGIMTYGQIRSNVVTNGASFFGGNSNFTLSGGKLSIAANSVRTMTAANTFSAFVTLDFPTDLNFVYDKFNGYTNGDCIAIGNTSGAGSTTSYATYGTVNFFGSDLSNCTGSNTGNGLFVAGNVHVTNYTDPLTGTGNAGWGVRLADGAQMAASSATPSITGTLGDFSLDGTTVATWAKLATYAIIADPRSGSVMQNFYFNPPSVSPLVWGPTPTLPVVTTGTRPASATELKGALEYNTTNALPEYNNGMIWVPLLNSFSTGTCSAGTAVTAVNLSAAPTCSSGFSSTGSCPAGQAETADNSTGGPTCAAFSGTGSCGAAQAATTLNAGAAPTCTTFVDITSAQTISGLKTFSNQMNLTGPYGQIQCGVATCGLTTTSGGPVNWQVDPGSGGFLKLMNGDFQVITGKVGPVRGPGGTTAANINMSGATTGNPVTVSATGTDSNITINLLPQGQGWVTIGGLGYTVQTILMDGSCAAGSAVTAVNNNAPPTCTSFKHEYNFSAATGTATPPTGVIQSMTTNAAGTVQTAYLDTQTASGGGGGPFEIDLKSATTTFVICNYTCGTAAPNHRTCTVNNSAIPTSTLIQWSISAHCAVSDPIFNVNATITEP